MLTGKVAFVTRASAPRGIGRAIALKLAGNGAHVVVTDIGGTIAIEAWPLRRWTCSTTLPPRSTHRVFGASRRNWM